MGQPFVVENRPSASSIVGSTLVAKAPPDGYTLLAMANTMLAAWAIIPNIGYDPVTDYAYVTMIAQIPNIRWFRPTASSDGRRADRGRQASREA
jgi:tripartite-type tricarboxylate transporter receptor subunit TctC